MKKKKKINWKMVLAYTVLAIALASLITIEYAATLLIYKF
jgi:hypothetical protein